MKYLKTYEYIKQEVKNTCEEILLELTDLGFKAIVTTDDTNWVRVVISKTDKFQEGKFPEGFKNENQDIFKIEDIKEYIDRIEEYLLGHGFKFDDPTDSRYNIKTEIIRNPADFSLYGIRSFVNLWFSKSN